MAAELALRASLVKRRKDCDKEMEVRSTSIERGVLKDEGECIVQKRNVGQVHP